MENVLTNIDELVYLKVVSDYSGDDSSFDTIISYNPSLNGTYDGWCINLDRVIYTNSTYLAKVYSSYETLPNYLIERPENLDLVNWLINQDFLTLNSVEGDGFSSDEIQEAIWTLVESDFYESSHFTNDSDSNYLVSLAQQFGEGFVPTIGQKMAVVLEPINYSGQTIGQVTIIPLLLTRENTFQDLLPEIQVEKTANITSFYEHKGANVTYSVTIQNLNNPNSSDIDPVTLSSFQDELWIDHNGDNLRQTNEIITKDYLNEALKDWQDQGHTGDIILNAGESFTFDYQVNYQGNNYYNPWEDPLNTITVTAKDDENNQVTATDNFEINILQKNQRSIQIDQLTGLTIGNTVTGSFKITNSSGDPVDVLINSLNLTYQEKSGKKWAIMDSNLYQNEFWLDLNPNGILDSNETILTNFNELTKMIETALVFGSTIQIGYETTFNQSVINPLKATTQITIDGNDKLYEHHQAF